MSFSSRHQICADVSSQLVINMVCMLLLLERSSVYVVLELGMIVLPLAVLAQPLVPYVLMRSPLFCDGHVCDSGHALLVYDSMLFIFTKMLIFPF